MADQRMDEAINRIVDAVVDRFEAAKEEGGPLEDVKNLVRGDRTASSVEPPSLWTWPDTATAATDMGMAETWNMPLVIAALVMDVDDPEAGHAAATNLAGRALQVVLDGGSRLSELKFVDDVTSLRFEPSGPRHTNDRRTLFWADAVVNVRFRRRQPS